MQANLSFSLIFNQTINFIRNRFWQLIIVSIILAIFQTSVTNHFMSEEVLDQISNVQDTSFIFPIIIRALFAVILTSLIIASINIATIYNLSISNKFNIKLLLSKSFSSLVRILGFNLIYTLIIFIVLLILSIVLFVLHMVVPQLGALIALFCIILAVIYLLMVYNFFVGSIITSSSQNFFHVFNQCHQFVKQYWKIGCLMIFIDIGFLILLYALSMNVPTDNFVLDSVLSCVSNFIDIFVMCFFYRLTQLITNNETNLTENNNTNLIL